jgi:hypothetical protein
LLRVFQREGEGGEQDRLHGQIIKKFFMIICREFAKEKERVESRAGFMAK